MEKFNLNEILENVKEFLRNSEDYQDMEIIYILKDTKDERNSLVVTAEGDEIIEINPYTMEVSNIPDWDYNFDEYIFKNLEENKEIAYMIPDSHYGIWITIDEYYPEDIENKKGMQKYLKYCKENNITKEFLEKECKGEIPNIMKYYQLEKNKEREER